jgi:hypothetical protein
MSKLVLLRLPAKFIEKSQTVQAECPRYSVLNKHFESESDECLEDSKHSSPTLIKHAVSEPAVHLDYSKQSYAAMCKNTHIEQVEQVDFSGQSNEHAHMTPHVFLRPASVLSQKLVISMTKNGDIQIGSKIITSRMISMHVAGLTESNARTLLDLVIQKYKMTPMHVDYKKVNCLAKALYILLMKNQVSKSHKKRPGETVPRGEHYAYYLGALDSRGQCSDFEKNALQFYRKYKELISEYRFYYM